MKRHTIVSALIAVLLCSCASVGMNNNGPSAGGSSDAMVTIPAGEFQMGMNGGEMNERPEHAVFLSRFSIDRYEVSARDFARFLNEKGNAEDKYFTADGRSTIVEVGGDAGGSQKPVRYAPRKGFENYPANNVSWFGADEYCRWKGGRLPSEAEWEKAARGTDKRKYPWGGESPDEKRARYRQEETKGPDVLVAVDSLAEGVSEYGVFNMAGNVLEWVNDWYRQNYCDFCGERDHEYEEAAAEIICVDKKIITVRTGKKKADVVEYNDPQGPEIGSFKVLRGGSWHDNMASALRSTRRSWLGAEERSAFTGFRCASGTVTAEPIATPDQVRKAMINCLPEEENPVVVSNKGSSVTTEEVLPPSPKIDILTAAPPLKEIVRKTPCPPGFENIYFVRGRSEIPDDAKPGLQTVAEWLKKNGTAKMLIEGRSDDRGTLAGNLALSEKRANAIKFYLVKLGVSQDRLEVKGYGDSQPLCKEAKNKGHGIRRRRACPLPRTAAVNKPKSGKKKTAIRKDDCGKANRSVQIVTIEKECRG